jgi:uncharacterized protein YgbK (DUF1537 family)
MEDRMGDLPVLSLDALQRYGMPDGAAIDAELTSALDTLPHKVVVLDDDPTGVQTVHGISVYTGWDRSAIAEGFAESKRLFFILTNSRSFTASETMAAHATMARNIVSVSAETGRDYLIISRGDSTLRGHFPIETDMLRRTIMAETGRDIDAEIIMPFFKEGGRYTIDGVHYVREAHGLVPAGQTEFARDKTFGYRGSHLGEWVEEKTAGAFRKDACCHVTLEELRSGAVRAIADRLLRVRGFNKVIVDAIDYVDVKVFMLACIAALHAGHRVMFRSAAALTKVIGAVPDRPLLSRAELVDPGNRNGGIVLIGSHVDKTTQQFTALLDLAGKVEFMEFNQHLVLREGGLEGEVARVGKLVGQCLPAGRTAVIHTRRERFDLDTADREQQLLVSTRISDALTSIITQLAERPAYIIAKGGITSSDVGTKALRVRKALVMGQIRPGIPVWMTGPESKFPNLPYIIFPGNVGERDTLRDIVAELDHA